MSLQGGFQEANVVFNEERLFEKIPFSQETTLRQRSITSFPVGAGGRMEQSLQDLTQMQPEVSAQHLGNHQGGSQLKQRCTNEVWTSPTPSSAANSQRFADLHLRMGCRNQKLLLEVLNRFSPGPFRRAQRNWGFNLFSFGWALLSGFGCAGRKRPCSDTRSVPLQRPGNCSI